MRRTHLAPLLLALALTAPASAGERSYAIEGRADDGQRWRGSGRLVEDGQELRATRCGRGTSLSGALVWREGAWRGRLSPTRGIAGVLEGAPSPLELELELRPDGEDFQARWSEVGGAAPRAGAERWQAGRGAEGLFAAVREAATRAAAAGKGTIAAEEVASAGSRVSPRVLIQGPAIFAEVARLIAGAEREVLIQTFNWETGCQASDRIVAGLRQLEANRRAAGATAPVQVRIVVNKHFLTTPKSWPSVQRDVARAGLDPRFVAVEAVPFKQRWLGFGLLHSKTVVVDGAQALITSANIHPPQDAGAPWYELAFTVSGPAARSFRADFAQLWRRVRGADLPALDGAPAPSLEGVAALVVSRPADDNPFHNRIDDPAARAYFVALAGARRQVRILTPHLMDDDIKDALLAAVRRGVKVELVVAKGKADGRSKIPGQGGTNVKNVTGMLEALRKEPAAAALLQVRWYSLDGARPVTGDGDHALHAKYLTIDDELAIVGSTNLDNQSINWSREINLVIGDPALVQAWDRQAFLPVFARAVPATRR